MPWQGNFLRLFHACGNFLRLVHACIACTPTSRSRLNSRGWSTDWLNLLVEGLPPSCIDGGLTDCLPTAGTTVRPAASSYELHVNMPAVRCKIRYLPAVVQHSRQSRNYTGRQQHLSSEHRRESASAGIENWCMVPLSTSA